MMKKCENLMFATFQKGATSATLSGITSPQKRAIHCKAKPILKKGLYRLNCRFASGFGMRYDKKQDFYETIGVAPRSKDSDIKKAYYKLA